VALDHIEMFDIAGESYAEAKFQHMDRTMPFSTMSYEVVMEEILWMIEHHPPYRNGILTKAKRHFPQFADRLSKVELLI
jgi:hypothetical protein